MKLYFRNTATGKRYDVVRMNKTTGEIVLKGEHAEFTEKYDKERFARLGYVLEKEVPDAVE
jgi:glutamine amidotransferase-like uncharacterized protein